MASVRVQTVINAPKKIEIALIRQDFAEMANYARILFEIMLAFTCVFVTHSMSCENPATGTYIVAGVVFLIMVSTLAMTLIYMRKARCLPNESQRAVHNPFRHIRS